jgi:hypothetical protein
MQIFGPVNAKKWAVKMLFDAFADSPHASDAEISIALIRRCRVTILGVQGGQVDPASWISEIPVIEVIVIGTHGVLSECHFGGRVLLIPPSPRLSPYPTFIPTRLAAYKIR